MGFVHITWALLGASPLFCQISDVAAPPSQFEAIVSQAWFWPFMGLDQYSVGDGFSVILDTAFCCTSKTIDAWLAV